MYMNASTGDVCYWQLTVDPVLFQNNHPYAVGQLSSVFINVAFNVAPNNVQIYTLQGNNPSTSVNVSLAGSSLGVFPLSNGQNVYIVAYPTFNQIQATELQFTYNLSTSFYPV